MCGAASVIEAPNHCAPPPPATRSFCLGGPGRGGAPLRLLCFVSEVLWLGNHRVVNLGSPCHPLAPAPPSSRAPPPALAAPPRRSTIFAEGGPKSSVSSNSLIVFKVYRVSQEHYSRAFRRRKAFPMTEIELNAMAALAIIGLSRIPKKGYATPDAIGTPSRL